MAPDLGIGGYLTSTPGVGGTIKARAEDFVVEEIPLPPPPSEDGPYSVATVRVRDWETNRLVRELARSLHVSRRRIGFAGTKDKRAVSTRQFSFEGIPPEALRALRLKDVEVQNVYTASRPVEMGDLLGNRFRIVVRDLQAGSEEAATLVAETSRQLLELGGFPNFFGVQRFGSVRPITHVVGRHIVRGDFRAAVETYIANPIEGEGEDSYEVREALAQSGDVRQALRTYPKAFSFEKAILNHLAVQPDDYIGGLKRLPFNLLLMFVHGYQSYLFNRILSERMRRGLPIHEPVLGDLVLPADRRGQPDRDRTIEVTQDNLGKVAQRCREHKAWVSAVLFGSESRFANEEPGQIERGIVTEEGLGPEDFVIPAIPRVSSKGARREILASVADLDGRVEGTCLRLSFGLTRGAYATSLLREYLKSDSVPDAQSRSRSQ